MPLETHVPRPANRLSAAIESEVIKESFTNVDGCRVRYLCGGNGPALVLIHGLLGYSFSWRCNLETLAKYARVYALDLPGTGLSAREPALPGEVGSLALQVLAFMQAVQIEKAVLLGSSHGGGVALVAAALAAERNVRVAALVLVSPVNPWSSQGVRLASLAGSAVGSRIVRSLGWCIAPLHGTILKRMYGDPQKVTREAIEGYSQPIRIPGTLNAMLGRMKNWKADLRKIESALSQIPDVPVLLLWGERDSAVYLSSAQQLLRRLRLAELRVIPTAGHLPYEEVPDEFNRLVAEFLMKVPDRSIGKEGC